MAGVTAVFLTLAFIVIGFAFCAGLPQVTSWFAKATINADASPFTFSELVSCAEATREYTLGDHDLDALMQNVASINAEAETKFAGTSASELAYKVSNNEIAESDEACMFSTEAISHLDDVSDLVSKLTFPLIAVGVLAAFCLMATLWSYGARPIYKAFIASGAATIAVIVAFGAAAATGFSAFFNQLHSLFFAEGSWQFPASSLLITIYPEQFWINMGVLWAATSIAFALVALIAGFVMRRKHKLAGKI
jgi:integral membrane protein (TIGR01906 family)